MKSDKKNPTIILVIAIIAALILFLNLPENLVANYTSLVLILVTMFYVYFTYLILITTRINRPLPHIDAEFIVIKNLTPDFIKKYGVYLREDDRFKTIEEEIKNSNPNKNIVFLKAKNIGNVMAIDVVFYLKYEFNNNTAYANQNKPLSFGNIDKEGKFNIKIVDVYNNPNQQTDFLKLKECSLQFNDVNNKQLGEEGQKIELSRDIKVSVEEGVAISFSRI